MKPNNSNLLLLARLVLLLVGPAFWNSCALQAQPALAVFGYKYMSPNWGPTPREFPTARRHCLVVRLDDAQTATEMSLPDGRILNTEFYQTNVFDANTPHSVNGFMIENSCDVGFSLLRATGPPFGGRTAINGVTELLSLTQDEIDQLNQSRITSTYGQVALSAVFRNGFPLGDYDFNGDNVISHDEFVLLVVFNQPGGPGQTAHTTFSVPGSNKRCSLQVSAVPESTVANRFPTVTHELLHNVANMLDFYDGIFYPSGGNPYTLNRGFTLASDINETHLDPWSKMAMGWNQPRIVSMRKGGVFSIPATQNRNPAAPILLYDPSHGTDEYFLLEYRTRSLPTGAGFESMLLSEGLLIWHVQQNPQNPQYPHELVLATTNPFSAPDNNTPKANWIEGPPDLRTPNAPWLGGQMTPYLRWGDGSDSPCRVRARPFNTTNNSITVEIFADGPDNATWVDFRFSGFPIEMGNFDLPFNTLGEGLAAVGHGGQLLIKSGKSNPTPISINQPLTIQAYNNNGPVVIGP